MNEEVLAQQIAAKVIHDAQFWTAVVGLIGAIVGAGLTIVGNFLEVQHEQIV